MVRTVSVKVSSRYQIAVPRIARERLDIQSGDRLLVDIQDGMIILLPQPQNYTHHLSGLHKEILEGKAVQKYLDGERDE